MEPFRFHLFVCTQQKPEGVPSCPASGSFALLSGLDREIQARGLSHDVQITACGCMGLCDEAPVMVVYPAGVWYRRVQPSDVSDIVGAHLSDGKPVARLEWNDAPAMKAMAVEHGEKFLEAMAARDKAGTLPDRLDQMIRGYMPSRCLLTALELDIFTAVGVRADAAQIGNKINAPARATAMLLNALVALGLLTKSGDEYKSTPESGRFFVQGSKDNHRNGLLHTANIWHRWSTLTEAVRRGTRVPIEGEVGHKETPAWTRDFIAAMQRNAKDRAPLLVKALGTSVSTSSSSSTSTSDVRRILDLGGGSGAYSIAFARTYPNVQCVILDVPEVVPLTAEYVRQAGVSAQVSLRAGDMIRDDFGSDYDIIMLNAICHMFSEEQNRDIFRRAYQALAPGGRLVVQDFILNPDKSGPQHAALFSLNMLVETDSGASYNESEYSDWMRAAGFLEIRRINLPGPSSLILGSRK
jgi:(2Fe-2S) ferredoxin/predicted O-methyltransferase YrrM